MCDLKTYPNFTLVGIKDRIVFFSPQGSPVHEIVLKEFNSPAHEEASKNGNPSVPQPHVVTFEYCGTSNLLAVSVGDKSLRCFSILEKDGKVSSEPLGEPIPTTKTIVCMKFAPKHDGLLFGCDKGDCYEFNMRAEASHRSKWILGHMSQILDVAISPDERYIVTCDRDEKIKVTSYPDCHNIECYCLGHLEYVGALAFLSPGRLLSVSGDKTLRVWQYVDGKEVVSHQLQEPAVHVSVRPMADEQSGSLCVVKSFVENKLELVHIANEPTNGCTDFEALELDANFIILNAVLSASLELYLLVLAKESKAVELLVYEFIEKEKRFQPRTDHPLRLSFLKTFEGATIDQVRNYSTLFKNSVDNLTDYFERKKQKIGKKGSE
ncbi:hypothetical protein AND_004071 [Anopheles darlingi]|uniref:tRNA (guanine-N(7)-)-methyltransferase non-catalytic subunit wuho n=1 Tax=Anopheles darlingi TaxID=43151 RepID=W5JIH5_ANODA|nr:hypothetical protein AND_004071 [Anopheles darlingi]